MNRRKFVTGSVGVAVGANVMRWARLGEAQVDKSKLSKTLGFASGGGAWQKALTDAALKPFEDEFGVKIEQDSFGNEAEALAKLRAAGPGAYDVVAGNESGLT